MTSSELTAAPALLEETSVEGRRRWTAPAMIQLCAGKAEAGFDTIVADGAFSQS